jgi:hypothetical protein
MKIIFVSYLQIVIRHISNLLLLLWTEDPNSFYHDLSRIAILDKENDT